MDSDRCGAKAPWFAATLAPAEVLLYCAYIRGIVPAPLKEGYVWESGNIYVYDYSIFCSVKKAVCDGFAYNLRYNDISYRGGIVPISVLCTILKEISNDWRKSRQLRCERANNGNWDYIQVCDRKQICLEFDDQENAKLSWKYIKS